jgi:SAM-dependent methyltransferase
MDEVDFAFGGADAEAGPWISMRGSTYELPFLDESFDCIILSEVLEHLHEDRRALAEVTRVLRGGGVLAVSVPRTGPEAICWALSRDYRNSPGGHVRIYLRSVLRRLLEETGYRIVGSHYAHGLHSPYWWLKCAIGLAEDRAWPVELYHRLLVWDLMQKPLATRAIEACLNPFIGKSVVFYAVKGSHS